MKEFLSPFIPSGLRMAGAGVQFLSTILIARFLGSEGASMFFFWSMIMMNCAPMAAYGIEQLVLRDIPRLKDSPQGTTINQYLRAIRLVSLSFSLIIGIALMIYAALTGSWASWQLLIPVGIGALCTVLINGEILKGLSKPLLGVLFGHFIPVTLFFLFILCFGKNLDSTGLLMIWIICFIAAVFLVKLSKQPEFQSLNLKKPDSVVTRTLLKEGAPVFGGSVFGALGLVGLTTILEATRPEAEISYLNTSFRISLLCVVLAAAVHAVFAPKISLAAQSQNTRDLFSAYGKAVGLALTALAPPILLGIMFPSIVMKIFGPDFVEGAPVLRLFLIFNLVTLVLGPSLQLLVMTGYSNLLPKIGVVKFIIAIVAGLLWIPKHGAVGMVMAMAVSYLLEEVVALAYVIWKRGFEPSRKGIS